MTIHRSQVNVDGSGEMRPGKRGRMATRVVLVVTLAAAVIAGYGVAAGTDVTSLAEVFWGYSVNR